MSKKKTAETAVVESKKSKKQKTKTPWSKERFSKLLFGTKDDMGLLKKIVVYVILICVGFIFVYPMAQIVSTSLMNAKDLMDSSINWIPSKFSFANYKVTMDRMEYWKCLKDSTIIAGIPTLCQVVICSIVGYGLARYNFKGKGAIMALLIVSFIIPSQVMAIPIFYVYSRLGITGSPLAFILPALFGQGFKAQLFILICWSFFRQIPQVLNEASQIDGAGHFKQFYKIAIPSAKGALVVVFLFSFVWYWNEDYLTTLYLYKKGKVDYEWTPVINELATFNASTVNSGIVASQTGTSGAPSIATAYSMAATVLAILPLIIIYLILQKQFVESIDRAGITGE